MSGWYCSNCFPTAGPGLITHTQLVAVLLEITQERSQGGFTGTVESQTELQAVFDRPELQL